MWRSLVGSYDMSIQFLQGLVLLIYGAATIGYVGFFVQQKKAWQWFTTPLLGLGMFLHIFSFIHAARVMGRLPIASVYEVLFSVTLVFVILYIILEFYINDKSLGVVIAPLILLLQLVSSLGLEPEKTLSPQLEQIGTIFQIHVIFMLLAYAGFVIAFIASVMHLLLNRELHQKQLGFFFSRLSSLELLDRLNSTAASLGFVFATIGMLLGFFMAMQLWGTPFPLDPKFISFVFTWAIYAFHLYARWRMGWQGQRAAWLSVIGFIALILTFLVVSLFFTQMHLYR